MINIRLAVQEDAGSVTEIYNQAVAAGQRTADMSPVSVESRRLWLESHNPEKYPVLVAEAEGKVIGWLSISAYRPGRHAVRYTAEVSYYVHFDYHQRGIGSALLEEAIKMCPSLEIKTLFAILLDSNIGSVRILEKFGFVRWGHMPGVADFDGVEVGHLYYGLRINEEIKNH